MRGDFARFWRLPGPERTTLLLALVFLPLAAFAPRLFGYRLAWKILARLTRLRSTDPGDTDAHRVGRAETMTRLVAAAANRSFFVPSCLTRSLVLCWLLRRQGIHGDLRFGVRLKDEGKELEAHAWVEIEGRIFDPSGEWSSMYAATFGGPMPLDESDQR